MRYKEDQLMYGSFLVGHPVTTPEFDSRQQSVPSHVCIPGVSHVRTWPVKDKKFHTMFACRIS